MLETTSATFVKGLMVAATASGFGLPSVWAQLQSEDGDDHLFICVAKKDEAIEGEIAYAIDCGPVGVDEATAQATWEQVCDWWKAQPADVKSDAWKKYMPCEDVIQMAVKLAAHGVSISLRDDASS